ncbi:hypothetical protein P4I92_16800, partial [Bacillus cereus]
GVFCYFIKGFSNYHIGFRRTKIITFLIRRDVMKLHTASKYEMLVLEIIEMCNGDLEVLSEYMINLLDIDYD